MNPRATHFLLLLLFLERLCFDSRSSSELSSPLPRLLLRGICECQQPHAHTHTLLIPCTQHSLSLPWCDDLVGNSDEQLRAVD